MLFLPRISCCLLLSTAILMPAARPPHAAERAVRGAAAAKPAKAARPAAKEQAAWSLTDPDVVQRQETYKQVGEVTLKIDIFEPRSKDSTRQYPAIVFFFGGGWVGGSPSQFYPHCEYLAGRGMIALAADYRVRSRHQTTPVECVRDGKSAVRWVRSHAARLGIDPDRIAAGGGSAGGHVAAAVATTNGFEEPNEDSSVSCRPNTLVLFNPVFDNGPQGYGHDRVQDVFPAISPLHNLRPGTPPTCVFLGTQDKLIPVATAKDYQAKMQHNGDRCDLHLYEDQTHGFFNHRGTKNVFYYRTLAEADRFLASLGWIAGEPTIAADWLSE